MHPIYSPNPDPRFHSSKPTMVAGGDKGNQHKGDGRKNTSTLSFRSQHNIAIEKLHQNSTQNFVSGSRKFRNHPLALLLKDLHGLCEEHLWG